MKKILISFAAAVLFSSCYTTVNINDDMSPAEIIQRAHEASDRNHYDAAMQYYQFLGERYSDHIDLVITSKYHIAFINYKQKNYTYARQGMDDVLSYYNTPDAIFLPQHYKRLAQIVLENMNKI